MAAGNSHTAENRMSRQIIDNSMKAGGASASSGTASASPAERRATVSAITPNPSQYKVTIRRNMLPGPGAIGSISHQTMVWSGDCQSPSCQPGMELEHYAASLVMY